MGKHPSIFNAFSSVIFATTVSPAFIPHGGISLDPALERKTRWIVLEEKDGFLTASVFRESGSELGCLSREIYPWTGRKWGRAKKDRRKYRAAPDPPKGAAHQTNLNGIEFWTVDIPTETEIERLRSLISILLPSTYLGSIVAHSVIR